MEAHLLEWLHLASRWVHIIAGIMWIGDSFLFMWLDSHLSPTDEKRGGPGQMGGELWMVHSGGFYEVYKRKYLRPQEIPKELFWFKWESYTTWLTGLLLLITVYYLGSGALLVEPTSALSHGGAVALSLGSLVVAWLVYDLLCRTPLAQDLRVWGLIGLGLVTAVAYGFSLVFTGRAAFMQVGAMIGTVMAANVFFRIIPAQKALLAATHAGTTPDVMLGARAKMRSRQNHYLTLPLLFTMLSNHFPATFGHEHPWLVLALLCIAGVALKSLMITKTKSHPVVIGGLAVSLGLVMLMTSPTSFASKPAQVATGGTQVRFADVHKVIEARCLGCHAEKPTTPGFLAPPLGVMLDTPARIKGYAERIKVRAVTTKTMPLGNLTAMTDEERELLGRWTDQGAPLE